MREKKQAHDNLPEIFKVIKNNYNILQSLGTEHIQPGSYAVVSKTKLEAQGFRVTFAAHFDRDTLLQDGRQGVAKWLKMFGSSFFEGLPQDKQEQILNEITDLLEPDYNKDANWYADYKRLRFIAVKE